MKNEELKTVKLTTALKRGEQEISEIQLIKPTVRALKGLKLFDLLQLDTEAIATLLPRITVPSLTKEEALKLDVIDFTSLSTEIVGFFVNSEGNPSPTE